MTNVQWWASGVVLDRNFAWPSRRPAVEETESVSAKVRDVQDSSGPRAEQAASMAEGTSEFDRVC
jgi:hypothetical protein